MECPTVSKFDSAGHPGDSSEYKCKVNLGICVHCAKYSLCQRNLPFKILLNLGYI